MTARHTEAEMREALETLLRLAAMPAGTVNILADAIAEVVELRARDERARKIMSLEESNEQRNG